MVFPWYFHGISMVFPGFPPFSLTFCFPELALSQVKEADGKYLVVEEKVQQQEWFIVVDNSGYIMGLHSRCLIMDSNHISDRKKRVVSQFHLELVSAGFLPGGVFGASPL